jgi:hypothetical protein
MAEIDFPAKPFYIQSKINLSNWALTVEGGQIKTKQLQGNVNFLWTARKDPRGGSVLTNIGSGLVLTAKLQTIKPSPFLPPIKYVGGPLEARALDPTAPEQLFRAATLDGDWREINALLNWEMKINVYGSDPNGTIGLFRWDGGAPNESWLLREETAEVETVSIEYNKDLARVDLSLPPKFGDVSVWDNRKGTSPLTGTTSISSKMTKTRQITNSTSDTTGQKYTQTFGMKGGIDKVFEVTASASFEESSSKTIAYSDQTTHTNEETITKTVNYNVPPGQKYQYQLVINVGSCDVPYTAHMKFQSAVTGSQPAFFDTQGVFKGMNQTGSEVVVTDVTTPSEAAPRFVARLTD